MHKNTSMKKYAKITDPICKYAIQLLLLQYAKLSMQKKCNKYVTNTTNMQKEICKNMHFMHTVCKKYAKICKLYHASGERAIYT